MVDDSRALAIDDLCWDYLLGKIIFVTLLLVITDIWIWIEGQELVVALLLRETNSLALALPVISSASLVKYLAFLNDILIFAGIRLFPYLI